jgi:hypothetical protein
MNDLTGPIPQAEREAIRNRVLQLAEKIHEELPEPWKSREHGELLYGEDGLPR